ncbi:hypothetical protein C5C03_11335 [Clavibacter michiganensis]|uniref:hypothetical protein n=1 Tax=Clavibacter michiganensis TaxID=28447 RepID=UPI000CE7F2F2|nr:hypothetical protein [Clavibacter michiganensis]PPF87126.1 hypothetical protein C5C03_11335 [Clavibacter michiganensis]PPF92374.1 hypothetical protein C5C05_14575 [Clavibacter michiganensis]
MNSRSKAPIYVAVAAVVALGFTCISSGAADAAEMAQPPGSFAISGQATSRLHAELDASDVPREISLVDGRSVTTYHMGSGIEIVYPEGAAATPPQGEFESKISGGLDDGTGHPYILLNSFDQDAIINGSGFLIGIAACGAFPETCVITTGVLAAAQQYLSYNGKCSDDRQLLLPFFGHEAAWSGVDDSWIRCV